ncbi:NAD(P)H-binding protein [Amycolatopsis roodepoortensis]|uniref:NAD(P)-dependent oxidoreductase n=1 Tax=Amycolatopsis roodepoortensis TaxID=700274 RepID=UPI00214C80D0|nr:NAD(P)H-binding protein [Amycolatopsis roodepoortensis]UUV31952.1 NAD(P)H-binding protein [Amycolatopsis roodepoortensis]
MKIAVVGASGMAGSRVVAEAVSRGHHVIAVFRRTPPDLAHPDVDVVRGDVTDTGHMSAVFGEVDAVVGATRPAPGAEDTVAATVTALLDAAAGKRVLVVGGAGPLRSPSGGLVIDDPAFVPTEWRPIASASMSQLRACEAHVGDWVYLSPPAILEPGVRTGTYRRGTTTILTAENGSSGISAEDLAVAIVDELENPGRDRHFTVGY